MENPLNFSDILVNKILRTFWSIRRLFNKGWFVEQRVIFSTLSSCGEFRAWRRSEQGPSSPGDTALCWFWFVAATIIWQALDADRSWARRGGSGKMYWIGAGLFAIGALCGTFMRLVFFGCVLLAAFLVAVVSA